MRKRGKRNVVVFVSYARLNSRLASTFLSLFKQQVGASKSYRYSFWRDTDILVGEDWKKAIENAIDECHLGLLLISPAFLGSDYISRNELPRLLRRREKVVIPVMLQPVDPEHHDLKGLDYRQIFRLQRETFRGGPKAFAGCKGEERNEFALELFRQVEARLNKQFGSGSPRR